MEKNIQIGYLGPAGTYSEEAALLFAEAASASMQPFPDIQSVIRAVADGQIDRGVVPLENSLEGSVNITLDTLAHDVELFIVREIILPIRHALFSTKAAEAVATVASHPQALAQCRHYLEQAYPQAKIRAVESTAAAAEMAAAGCVDAAIASLRAGRLFGLPLLAQDIQDTHCNQTRFVVLSRRQEADGAAKMSLVCRIRGDKPGTLYEMLSEFARHGVNLTRIESRPARTGLGEYIFFIDLDGAMDRPSVAQAVNRVAAASLWFKNLGAYVTLRPDQSNQ